MTVSEIKESKDLLEERIHEIDERIAMAVGKDGIASYAETSAYHEQITLREAYVSSYKSLFLIALYQLSCLSEGSGATDSEEIIT